MQLCGNFPKLSPRLYLLNQSIIALLHLQFQHPHVHSLQKRRLKGSYWQLRNVVRLVWSKNLMLFSKFLTYLWVIGNRPIGPSMMWMKKFLKQFRNVKKCYQHLWIRLKKVWMLRWKNHKRKEKLIWTVLKQSWRIMYLSFLLFSHHKILIFLL